MKKWNKLAIVLLALALSGCSKEEVKTLPPLNENTPAQESAVLIIPADAKVTRIDGKKLGLFRKWWIGYWSSWTTGPKAATLLVPAGEHTILFDYSNPNEGWKAKKLEVTTKMSAGKMYLLSVTVDGGAGTGSAFVNKVASYIRDDLIGLIPFSDYLPASNPEGIVYRINETDQTGFDQYLRENAFAKKLLRTFMVILVLLPVLLINWGLSALWYFMFMWKFKYSHPIFSLIFSIVLGVAGILLIKFNASGTLLLFLLAILLMSITASRWYSLGRALNELAVNQLKHPTDKNLQTAVDNFGLVIMLDPYNAVYHYNLGIGFVHLQDWGSAIDSFNKAIKYAPKWDPQYPEYCSHHGFACCYFQDWDAAIASFNEAVKYDPKNEAYRNNLANAQAHNIIPEVIKPPPGETGETVADGIIQAIDDVVNNKRSMKLSRDLLLGTFISILKSKIEERREEKFKRERAERAKRAVPNIISLALPLVALTPWWLSKLMIPDGRLWLIIIMTVVVLGIFALLHFARSRGLPTFFVLVFVVINLITIIRNDVPADMPQSLMFLFIAGTAAAVIGLIFGYKRPLIDKSVTFGNVFLALAITAIIGCVSSQPLRDFQPDPSARKLSAKQLSYFTYEGDTTLTITGYTGKKRTVIIPSQINGKPVAAIGNRAFYGKRLTSVTIPDSVVKIESSAFRNTQLTSVSIPDSVLSIGDYAFMYLDDDKPKARGKLNSVTIGNSVTSIGRMAFGGNQLTSVTIPASVTSIGESAFAGNNTSSGKVLLNSVIFEGNKVTMAPYAFGITSSGDTDIAELYASGGAGYYIYSVKSNWIKQQTSSATDTTTNSGTLSANSFPLIGTWKLNYQYSFFQRDKMNMEIEAINNNSFSGVFDWGSTKLFSQWGGGKFPSDFSGEYDPQTGKVTIKSSNGYFRGTFEGFLSKNGRQLSGTFRQANTASNQTDGVWKAKWQKGSGQTPAPATFSVNGKTTKAAKLSFPSGFRGKWKRDGFDTILTFKKNTLKVSDYSYLTGKLTGISGDVYETTFNVPFTKKTLTGAMTINFINGNLEIFDDDEGKESLTGTWKKQ